MTFSYQKNETVPVCFFSLNQTSSLISSGTRSEVFWKYRSANIRHFINVNRKCKYDKLARLWNTCNMSSVACGHIFAHQRQPKAKLLLTDDILGGKYNPQHTSKTSLSARDMHIWSSSFSFTFSTWPPYTVRKNALHELNQPSKKWIWKFTDFTSGWIKIRGTSPDVAH